MNTNMSFHKTIAGSLKSTVDVDIWDKVLKQYEAGDYAGSIRNCINYVDASIELKYANAERTEYHIPHGSIIVEVKITEQELTVQAPFLDIEGAKQIPVLRQAAQINFTPLTIAGIALDGNKLYFRYSCPLASCEPYKVYDVLREICITADNYDDEFISKFEAKRIQEPTVYQYTPEEKEFIRNTLQLYIKEAFEAYEQLENKRQTSYLWDVLIVTLLKIDYFCAPQGSLRNEIEKTLAYLNGKEDYYQRLSVGKDFLKKLQAYDRAKLEQDLYKIEVFVPYKFRTTLETVRNGLKYAYETADKELKAEDPVGATLTMQYGILNFLYDNNMEDAVAEVLMGAMEKASGKPIAETARLLYDALNTIMTRDSFLQAKSSAGNIQGTEENHREKKGFFKRIFGG